MKIFSGSSSQALAKQVALGLNQELSPIEVHVFPDGERRIRVDERVVDEHAVVIQSANTPVDTNYMELFFLVDALKRSGAEKVTVVVPYFGYQRQDHVFREGEAVSLEVIIEILEKVGVDRLVSFDMHSVKIPDLFHVPVSHLSALPLFASQINRIMNKESGIKQEGKHNSSFIIPNSDYVLVSPDMGGIARIKKLSELLDDMPYAAIEKDRDLESGAISSTSFGEGSVKGKKVAFMVDDMISSGKTIVAASDVLEKSGISEIYVFATHAVFSEDAHIALQNSKVKKVFVTDSVYVAPEKGFKKLEIISVAEAIGQELQQLATSQ